MLFLVNLDTAIERRAAMAAQLGALGLDFRRVGVDFREQGRAAIDAWLAVNLPGIAFAHRRLSGAEIGCWSSHLLAWKTLASDDSASACAVIAAKSSRGCEGEIISDESHVYSSCFVRQMCDSAPPCVGTSVSASMAIEWTSNSVP